MLIGIGRRKGSEILFERELSKGTTIAMFEDARSFMDALLSREVRCGVRGNLRSAPFLEELGRIDGTKARRAAIFSHEGIMKALLPVGIDEGTSPEERADMVQLTAESLGRINSDIGGGSRHGERMAVGILSAGRPGDAGRSPEISTSLEEGQRTAEICVHSGLDTRFFGIEIEKALPSSDIIVAPDGIIGNYIFRVLFHFAGIEFMGAICLGLPFVLVDSSSSRQFFDGPVRLAALLARSCER